MHTCLFCSHSYRKLYRTDACTLHYRFVHRIVYLLLLLQLLRLLTYCNTLFHLFSINIFYWYCEFVFRTRWASKCYRVAFQKFYIASGQCYKCQNCNVLKLQLRATPNHHNHLNITNKILFIYSHSTLNHILMFLNFLLFLNL